MFVTDGSGHPVTVAGGFKAVIVGSGTGSERMKMKSHQTEQGLSVTQLRKAIREE